MEARRADAAIVKTVLPAELVMRMAEADSLEWCYRGGTPGFILSGLVPGVAPAPWCVGVLGLD